MISTHPLEIEVRQESSFVLAEYGRIPIAFEVGEIYEIASEADGQFRLTLRRLSDSYIKDYDAIGEAPPDWPLRFDTSHWAFFSAFAEGQRVGGTAVAWGTPNLDMLEGRNDLAVLWDLRVAPSHRRRGIGSTLFRVAAAWAAGRGCRQLKVETQNVNTAACRFYAQQGCTLMAANRGAYVQLPDEVQLLWYKHLVQQVPFGRLTIKWSRRA